MARHSRVLAKAPRKDAELGRCLILTDFGFETREYRFEQMDLSIVLPGIGWIPNHASQRFQGFFRILRVFDPGCKRTERRRLGNNVELEWAYLVPTRRRSLHGSIRIRWITILFFLIRKWEYHPFPCRRPSIPLHPASLTPPYHDPRVGRSVGINEPLLFNRVDYIYHHDVRYTGDFL